MFSLSANKTNAGGEEVFEQSETATKAPNQFQLETTIPQISEDRPQQQQQGFTQLQKLVQEEMTKKQGRPEPGVQPQPLDQSPQPEPIVAQLHDPSTQSEAVTESKN